jgi:phage shock protein B
MARRVLTSVQGTCIGTRMQAGTAGMNWNLIIIFGFVIILVSIRSHYRQREQTGSSLGAGDQMSLTRATETAHRLEQRVETLERLLDEDAPGWRARARS